MPNASRHIILMALVALWAVQAFALDCSQKPPCPPGTTAQESVSCDACCPDGSYIKAETDKYCCPEGHFLSPDGTRCLPDGSILKSDGSCWASSETAQCCRDGWHTVNQYECCPDGFTLATDNEFCCTQRADGKCCAPDFRHNPVSGACIPPRPKGVTVR